MDALIDDTAAMLRDADVAEPVLLKDEREKRRITREEMAARVKVKKNYYRHIEMGTKPSKEVREAIRAVLAECPVHRALGIRCKELPVPPDEELYAPATQG